MLLSINIITDVFHAFLFLILRTVLLKFHPFIKKHTLSFKRGLI